MALWDHKSSDTLGIMRSELWRAKSLYFPTNVLFLGRIVTGSVWWPVFFRWKCSHRKTNHGNSKDNITLLRLPIPLPVLSSVGKEPVTTFYNANVLFLQLKNIALYPKIWAYHFYVQVLWNQNNDFNIKMVYHGGKASPLRILLCVVIEN